MNDHSCDLSQVKKLPEKVYNVGMASNGPTKGKAKGTKMYEKDVRYEDPYEK